MKIRPLVLEDIESVKEFADKNIGLNYFSLEELKNNVLRSYEADIPCSFVLENDHGQIKGLRLAYPPGQWTHGKGNKISPELWEVPKNQVAYFQSLFLSEDVRGLGFGPKLSNFSLASFTKLGAKAVVTHAWVESPENSSIRYLEKMGFQSIAKHENYWIEVQYQCSRDGYPCKCSALEMIKYL